MPRAKYRNRESVLAGFQAVKPDVSSLEEAAERMSMNFLALRNLLYRAKTQGDQRGDYKPLAYSRKSVRNPDAPAWWEPHHDRYEDIVNPDLSLPEIAEQMGIALGTLHNVITDAKKAGRNVTPTGLPLPVAPLRRLAEVLDIELSDFIHAHQQTVGFHKADEIACKVFRMHPSLIWGADYWRASYSAA